MSLIFGLLWKILRVFPKNRHFFLKKVSPRFYLQPLTQALFRSPSWPCSISAELKEKKKLTSLLLCQQILTLILLISQPGRTCYLSPFLCTNESICFLSSIRNTKKEFNHTFATSNLSPSASLTFTTMTKVAQGLQPRFSFIIVFTNAIVSG